MRLIPVCGAALVGTALLSSAFAAPARAAAERVRGTATLTTVAQRQANLPLVFEPNQGQTGRQVQYLAHAAGYTLFLTASEVVMALHGPDSPSAVHMRLEGAASQADSELVDRLPGVSNYFVGRDARQWRTNIPQYGRVRYRSVYPGIDVVYYGNKHEVEYDFVLQPGADPDRIQMSFCGVDGLRVDKKGDLVLNAGGREVRQKRPLVYQEVAGRRVAVESRYVLAEYGHVQVALARYDRTKTLVIDPAIAYSTYLGGTGTDSIDSIAVDGSGNLYAAGTTDSIDFPTTTGAYSSSPVNVPNSRNAFVAKLNPAGTAVLYSTYVGPTGDLNYAVALAIDGQGSAYITGYTGNSALFPSTPGAYLPANNGAFVTKLSPTGTALVYSTGIDNAGAISAGIAVDAQGNAYVAGSATGTFPAVPAIGPFPASQGVEQAFGAALNTTGTSLLYAARFGGSGSTAASSIAVDSTGQATIAGRTTSSDFPVSSLAYQKGLAGSSDAFVLRLNPTGTTVIFSTLLGGSAADQANAVAIDGQGNAYIAGTTNAYGFALTNNFPVTPGAYLYTDGAGFVAKFNPTGSSLLYSALFGSTNTYFGVLGLAVDGGGSAYVVGPTAVPIADFPSPGLQPLPALGFPWDGYLLKLDPTGSSVAYGSYFGGSEVDTPHAVKVDSSGSVYIAGKTRSADFPVTLTAPQKILRSTENGFAMKLDFSSTCTYSLSGTGANVQGSGINSSITMTTQAGCNWVAVSNAPWLTVSGAAAGTGSGTVSFQADVNYTNQARSGTIAVGGSTFVVAQDFLQGCRWTYSLSQPSFTNDASSGTITITTTPGCPWKVSSSAPWLAITSAASGTGPGTVSFQVTANTGARRVATLKIFDQTATISQAGPGCTLTLSANPSSFPVDGGTGTLTITAPSPSCAWTLSSTPETINFQNGGTISTGTGSASVNFFLVGNYFTSHPRTIAIVAQGQTISVSQAASGCSYSFGVIGDTFPAVASGGISQLQAFPQDCAWTATSDSSWLIVDTPAGQGSSSLQFHILANNGTTARQGRISAAGQSYTVTQQSAAVSTFSVLTSLYNTYSAFTVNRGSTLPLSRSINLLGTSPGSAYTSSVAGTPAIVSVSPATGIVPGSITLTASPLGLSPGTYTNTVTFTSGGASTIYTVSVTVLGAGPSSKTGVYRASTGLFLLDRNGDGSCCDGDLIGSLGQFGDLALAGDWTGDGVKKPGIYRPSTGQFLLDVNDNASFDSGVDKALFFTSQSGDVPVVGDWTGTGIDRAGVFRGSTGTWYLDVNGDGSFSGRAFLGQTGDTPIVGNWNGVGTKSKVGIFRTVITNTGSYNYFLLDYDGDGQYRPNGSTVDPGAFLLGQSGDVPLVGDWNGDGKTKVGIFRPSNGLLLLDQNGSFTWDGAAGDKALFFAPAINGPSVTTTIQPGDLPLTGDWVPSYAGPNTLNLRGRTRTGIYRPSTGTFFLDVSTDGTFQGRAYVGQTGDVPVGVPVVSNGVVVGVNGLGNY